MHALASKIIIPALLLLSASCSNDLEDAKRIASHANVNIENGTGVEINYTDNGITRIRASAPEATRHIREKPFLEFSKGIKVEFFAPDGRRESIMTARYATVVENSQEMIARDSVLVVNEKGEKLNTDELIWDEEKKIIYSNSFVRITTKDEIIYGKGFSANQNFSDYVIKSISGKIKVNAGEIQ